MMLRSKYGYVNFQITDKDTQEKWTVSPKDYLGAKQSRYIPTKPDMFWQFLQILKSDFASKGHDNITIYVTSKVGLNGVIYKPLYNPDYDFAHAEWKRFEHSEWLMPYEDDSEKEASKD